MPHHASTLRRRHAPAPSTTPLKEVEILVLPAHRLIGFPDAAPVQRVSCIDLDRDAKRVMRDLLGASPRAKAKLLDYAYTYGYLDGGGDDTDMLADVLGKLLRAGAIVLRGPAWYNGAPASLVTSGSGTLSLSNEGERFLYEREALRGVSERLYWPRGLSGVTLGAGYDMRTLDQDVIVNDLKRIGVDSATAESVGEASRLADNRAQTFADDNHNLIVLTDTQQIALMRLVLPKYKTQVDVALSPSIQPRLFQHEYDALVSFTYNLGHLGGTSVIAAVNNGNMIGAAVTMLAHFHTSTDRRFRETRLFKEAWY